MKKEFIASLIAHCVVIALFLFGQWPSRSLLEPERFIPFEIADIGDITQSNKPFQSSEVKPEPKPAEEKPEPTPPAPKPEPVPTPPLAEKQPDDTPKEEEEIKPEPKPEEEEPQEDGEEAKEEPEPDDSEAEEVPDEKAETDVDPEPEKKPEPEKPKEKPKPVPPSLPKEKPKPPKDTKKDEKRPAQKKKTAESVLKNLLKTSSAPNGDKKDESESDDSSRDGDDLPKGKEMTISERAALLQQMRKCWKVDVGAKNAKKFTIPVHLEMNPDASVKKAVPLKNPQYESDPFYQAAVRQAMNAIRNPACQKLDLPKGKYRSWKEFTFEFDPESMAY